MAGGKCTLNATVAVKALEQCAVSKDIKAMLDGLNELPTDQGFPAGSKLYVYQEVIDQNDGAIKVDEYYDTGKNNQL